MNVSESLEYAKDKLEGICERPLFESELLLSFHLNKDRVYLLTHSNENVANIEKFYALVDRRSKSEPYEYIVNKVSFYDIELYVKQGVLIARPETEILVDIVLDIIGKYSITSMAEVGIGSGAISTVLAMKNRDLKVVATDICDEPLEVAELNFKNFGVEKQIQLVKTDLLQGVDDSFELIVSNPPYIANDFVLKQNVSNYEPKEALFGGIVGDELLKRLVTEVSERKVRFLVCEMGYDQKDSMAKFMKSFDIKRLNFYKDLSNIDRGFVVEFNI